MRPQRINSLALLALLAANISAAQDVHVFDEAQPQDGNTIVKATASDESARLLVIPVVTMDTPFDPDNNDLNGFDPVRPNLRTDIQAQFAETDAFWREASYDLVGATAKVLPRYYQVPRGIDFYANPTFQDVRIASGVMTLPVAVPTGQFKIKARYTSSDETTYTINFAAGDGPFASMADLRNHINGELGPHRGLDWITMPFNAS